MQPASTQKTTSMTPRRTDGVENTGVTAVLLAKFKVFSLLPGHGPRCIWLLIPATLKFADFWCSPNLTCVQKTAGKNPPPMYIYAELKIRARHSGFVRKVLNFLPSSARTALHLSSANGHLEVCRFLVHSKSDPAAKSQCVRRAMQRAPSPSATYPPPTPRLQMGQISPRQCRRLQEARCGRIPAQRHPAAVSCRSFPRPHPAVNLQQHLGFGV
jgi:hypothetical protein